MYHNKKSEPSPIHTPMKGVPGGPDQSCRGTLDTLYAFGLDQDAT